MNATGVFRRLVSLVMLIAALGASVDGAQASRPPLDKTIAQDSTAIPKLSDSMGNPSQSTRSVPTDGQHFFCNTGYTVPTCLAEIAVLKTVLSKYPTKALGPWTWILVKSPDWKALITTLGMHPNTPAFTCLELKETFVEEALFIDVPERTKELAAQWQMKPQSLLDYAVAHEMGHGLCKDAGEEKAIHAAALLRAGKAASCVVRSSPAQVE